MKHYFSVLLPLVLLPGVCVFAPPATTLQVTAPPVRVRSSAPRPKVNPTPPLPPDSPVRAAVEASDRKDFEMAGQLLRALDPATMPPTEARRWRIFAQFTAPRTGDLALLKRANRGSEGLLFADARQILNAWEVAQANQPGKALQILAKVSHPDELDERSRRRYFALRASIAKMQNDTKTERVYLEKLVDYVGSWKTGTCQSCHENPTKYGDDVTSLDVNNLWIGRRYSALLQASGDAARVRRAAEKQLQADPDDEAARLRLAYALRGEKREADAVREMHRLDWAAFPERPYKEPDNKITFPGVLPIEHPQRVELFLPEDQVYSAADYLRAAEFTRCHRELAELGPKDKLSVRLRYRSAAIEASLARLENKPQVEKRTLGELVETLRGSADQSAVTTDFADTRKGDGKTFQEWQSWWVTRRLEALGDKAGAEKAKRLPGVTLARLDLGRNDLVQFP